MPCHRHGSNAGTTGGGGRCNEPRAEVLSFQPLNGLHCAGDTHTRSVRCHPHGPTVEPCPATGMVQTRVPRVAEAGATNPERKSCRFNPLMDCIALATHTRVPSGVTLTGPLLNHALPPAWFKRGYHGWRRQV